MNKLIEKWVDITTPTENFVEDNPLALAVIHLEQSAPRLKEEVEELERSLYSDNLLSKENQIALLDDVCDCLFVAAQQLEILRKAGFDVDSAFRAVCVNNDSKFLTDEREAQDTVQYYIGRGVDCYYEWNEYWGCFIVRRYSDNKVMKSKNFTPVDLSSFIPQ